MEALLMDVKKAFDHISRAELVKKMLELGVNGNLIEWAQSFLTDR